MDTIRNQVHHWLGKKGVQNIESQDGVEYKRPRKLSLSQQSQNPLAKRLTYQLPEGQKWLPPKFQVKALGIHAHVQIYQENPHRWVWWVWWKTISSLVL